MPTPPALLVVAAIATSAAAESAQPTAAPGAAVSRQVGGSPASAAQTTVARNEVVCNVTEPVKDRPPDDPHASSFASPNGIWYANEDRTVWAWWWGRRSVGDYKVLWVRPAGARLTIAGRRLDSDDAPLTAHVPDGYPWTFQASAIAFPAAGCWQIEGAAGDARLTFVVRIR